MLIGESDVDPEVIEYRTLRYFEQAECALATLREMFEEMKSNAIFDRAYIVLHGDHGSQISKSFPYASNIGVLENEDFLAHYSTLFAFKRPFGKFEHDLRALPISTLLEEFSEEFINQEKLQITEVEDPTQNNENTEAFIYLTGTYPLTRVDINLFDQAPLGSENTRN
jgi:hypothetical protein